MYWDYHSIQLGAQQGWQCPVCGKVNAPWMMQCTCDGKTSYKINYTRETSTTGSQIIYNNRPVTTSFSKTEYDCGSLTKKENEK